MMIRRRSLYLSISNFCLYIQYIILSLLKFLTHLTLMSLMLQHTELSIWHVLWHVKYSGNCRRYFRGVIRRWLFLRGKTLDVYDVPRGNSLSSTRGKCQGSILRNEIILSSNTRTFMRRVLSTFLVKNENEKLEWLERKKDYIMFV